MPSSRIRTGLNILVNIVNKRGEIKLSDAAKMLDLDEEALENLVKILVEHKILEIHYSIVGDKILKTGEKIKSTISREQIQEKLDETLTEEKIEEREETKEIERLLGVMKKKIQEKKGAAKPEVDLSVDDLKKIDEARSRLEELSEREVELRKREAELEEKEKRKLEEEEELGRVKGDLEKLRSEEEERRKKQEDEYALREAELKKKEAEWRNWKRKEQKKWASRRLHPA